MARLLDGYWSRYRDWYYRNYSPLDSSQEEGLPYLRDRLFLSLLIASFPIWVILYIPSVIISVVMNVPWVAVIDTLAISMMVYLFLRRSQSIRWKKILFSFTFYMLAMGLFLFMGDKGPTVVILVSCSIMVTLYMRRKAGYIALFANGILFFIILTLSPDPLHPFPLFRQYMPLGTFGVCINLFAFNAVAVISASYLVNQLHLSLLNSRHLQSLLQKESVDLKVAKFKAEESNRLKAAFLANINHEIRTPMNGILGFAELLSYAKLKEEDQKVYLNSIQTSGKRMLDIITQIIDISRIEAGIEKLEKAEVNLRKLTKNVYSLFEPLAIEKRLHMSCTLDLPKEEMWIRVDETKLFTILSSLLKNAIKFTDSGSINLNCRISYISQNVALPIIEYRVTDTGIGIPKERQGVVFEGFMQADVMDHEVREGAGLGLTIAKAYVDMMGGQLWFESEQNKGSSFYFTLPYYPVVKNK